MSRLLLLVPPGDTQRPGRCLTRYGSPLGRRKRSLLCSGIPLGSSNPAAGELGSESQ